MWPVRCGTHLGFKRASKHSSRTGPASQFTASPCIHSTPSHAIRGRYLGHTPRDERKATQIQLCTQPRLWWSARGWTPACRVLVPRWWLAPPPVARKLATWGRRIGTSIRQPPLHPRIPHPHTPQHVRSRRIPVPSHAGRLAQARPVGIRQQHRHPKGRASIPLCTCRHVRSSAHKLSKLIRWP
jgi:hypothetical protein